MKGKGLILTRPSVDAPQFAHVIQAGGRPVQRFYKTGPVLDQGESSKCGGYAADGLLQAEPIIQSVGADRIYYKAKELDNIAGPGTTMEAVTGALKSFGAISEAYFSYEVEDVYSYVSTISPVLIALDWRENMFRWNSKGFVKAGGDLIGGHCFLCFGVDMIDKEIYFRNSWGTDYGLNGDFCMTFKEFEKAFIGNGIAAAVKEIKIK